MKELRVLACAFACTPPDKPGFTGGEDLLGWNLLRQIARFHQVWVITNADNRESIEQALLDEALPNVQFCYVGLPGWLHPLLKIQGGHQFYYQLWQVKAYVAARKLQKDVSFNIFHHITYANDWSASFIGALLSVPYIRGPGGGAHRTPKTLESEYTVRGRLWERARSIGQWVFRHDPFFIRGHARARAILVCTKDSVTSIPEKWQHKVQLFPVSGISSEDLAMESSSGSDNQFRILTAGSLIRVKGFGLAIKAFQEFQENHPDSQFRIIGSGPEESRLKKIAGKSSEHSGLRFLESMPRDQLMAEMAAADVFLFPSLRDGGGTVVIEAMSAGKPVICLDAGGPGMHITEECGLKIQPADPESTVHELAAALEKMYLDPELRLKLGRSARERAERFYLWDKLGDRITGIYRDALGTYDG